MTRDNNVLSVKILNGQSTSGAVALGEYSMIALLITGTAWTAADLTFEASVDGTNWLPIYDDSNAIVKIANAAVARNQVYVPKAILNLLGGMRHLRFRSGVPGAFVNQGQDVTLSLIVKA